MKKILFALTLSAATATYAQNYSGKGSWYLGGSAGFSIGSTSQGNDVMKRSAWSASPEVGTFLTDHIQLGLGVTFNSSYTDLTPISNLYTIQYGGTVYGRYLFGENAFRPFVGVSASFLSGESRYYVSNQNTALTTIHANFTAGFAYYVTPRIGIFGSIGILGYTFSREILALVPNIVKQDFGFNASTLGNRFTIGMYYTFCNRKSAE